jgi:hypothetical protein
MIYDLIKIIFEYCCGIDGAIYIYENTIKTQLELPYPLEFRINSSYEKNTLISKLKIDINTLLSGNEIRVTSNTVLNAISKFTDYTGVIIHIDSVVYVEKYSICGRCSKNDFYTGFFNLQTCSACSYTEKIEKTKTQSYYYIRLKKQLTIQHIDEALF